MFFRKVKAKNTHYLVLVENNRINGKVVQKNIASLGSFEKLKQSGQLEKLGNALLKFCEYRKNPSRLHQIEEIERKIWGPVKIYKQLWNTFDLDYLFKILHGSRIRFDLFSAVFLMLVDRMTEPKSKLKSYEKQYKYIGINEIELQHLYRSLDVLCKQKNMIEKHLFEQNVNLFNMKVDVVLYDVTTLYFESTKTDALRKPGFSKDNKVSESQILLSMILNQEGRPVGFDIFPGNTFEGHTLKTAIEKLKNRFSVNRIIFIGDRGMLSQDNLRLIKDYGYEYIIGSRLKSKSDVIKNEVLRLEDYRSINEDLYMKTLNIEGDRLICIYSENRAKKDFEDRMRLIKKAIKRVEENGVLYRGGAYKYINADLKDTPSLNTGKIEEDEKWDGFYAIQTNSEITPLKAYEYYHDLWRIEETFRTMKTHLETRPIFHWTPKRITGHMVLCFIAFLLERTLELLLKKEYYENVTHIEDVFTYNRIRDAIVEMQVSVVDIEGEHFCIRSKISELGKKILKALKIKVPPSILPESDFNQFLS